MLTGADLLAKVKELGDAAKSDLVRGCGYVSTKKDGTERLNFTAFYEALLEAKGMSLGTGAGGGRGKAGRSLSYVAKVQFNGNLLVGKAYTAPLSWVWNPAMSSRSSWAASRSNSSPLALQKRIERRFPAQGACGVRPLRAVERDNRLRPSLVPGHAHHPPADPPL